MKMTFLFLVSATTIVTLLHVETCYAAPRKPIKTYNQRQDGELNVETKFENLLFVYTPTSSVGNVDFSGLLESYLVAQSLNQKNVASRVANHPENPENSAKSDDFTDPAAEISIAGIKSQGFAEEKAEKEPEPSVELVAIVQRDLPDAIEFSQPSKTSLKKEDSKTEVNIQAGIKAHDASETARRNTRSLTKISDELFVSNLPSRAIDQQVSLENKVSGIGINDRGNDVGPVDVELQEMKLLGGAIENCGPSRFRDRFGVCQFRGDT